MALQFTTAIRGNFFDIAACVEAPQQLEERLRHVPDGLLLLNDGVIVWFGSWQQGEALLPPGFAVTEYRDKPIVPGFIDTHIHYPQTEMIGAYGDQLLDWLNNYTFPTESRYGCEQHADAMSAFFLRELLSNGTTTALVFGTVHPQSVDTLFSQAAALNMRLIAGKVMMDRHAPEALLETPEQSYRQTRELIERWHGKGRLGYAITPRFAPTSTPALLAQVQRLREEFPDVWRRLAVGAIERTVAELARHALQLTLQRFDALPGPAVIVMLLVPGLPLLALAFGDVLIAQQGIPVCGHFQRLALLGGDGVAHE